ncbi:predicted protein [Postia placenta Mad-698-R]|nr:predicted protein [Postia placenta Mad-698-R]
MRRIAAVFASRRTDKSDATSSHRDDASTQHAQATVDAAQKQQQLLRPKARFFRTISRRAPALSSPHISTEPASSSSSSAGPPTPDDDARSLHPDRVYLQPFPDKAPPAEPTAVRAQASSMIPSQSRSALTASQSASAIAAVGPARSALAHLLPHPRLHLNDTDDDTSDSGDSERYAEPPPRARTAQPSATPVARVPPLPAVVRQETARARPLTAMEYTRALAQNALLPPFAPPPTLHVSDAPVFPRSCNLHSVLQSAPRYDGDALLPQLFQRRILHRLAVPGADTRALAPFARRGKAPAARGPTLVLDDTAVPKAFARGVRRYSEGLLRWIERPCFEDRFAVYLPRDAAEQEHGEDAVVCVRVSGTGQGEALEAPAGVFADEDEDLESRAHVVAPHSILRCRRSIVSTTAIQSRDAPFFAAAYACNTTARRSRGALFVAATYCSRLPLNVSTCAVMAYRTGRVLNDVAHAPAAFSTSVRRAQAGGSRARGRVFSAVSYLVGLIVDRWQQQAADTNSGHSPVSTPLVERTGTAHAPRKEARRQMQAQAETGWMRVRPARASD